MRATGHATMNLKCAQQARGDERLSCRAREKKKSRFARTKFPPGLFRAPTWRSGKEIQPDGRYCRQDPCGWLGSAQDGDEDSIPPHRILRREHRGEATKPAARILG